MVYADTTPMPWGRHKGKAMANVPADYLLWLLNCKYIDGPLKTYIVNNLDALKKDAANKSRYYAR